MIPPRRKNPLKYYGKGCSDIQVTNASNGHKKIIIKCPWRANVYIQNPRIFIIIIIKNKK